MALVRLRHLPAPIKSVEEIHLYASNSNERLHSSITHSIFVRHQSHTARHAIIRQANDASCVSACVCILRRRCTSLCRRVCVGMFGTVFLKNCYTI